MIMYIRCRGWRNTVSRRRKVRYKLLGWFVDFFGVAIDIDGYKFSSLSVVGV